MARLEEALHHSEAGAAYFDTADGYRVIVERKLRTRRPGGDDRYLVRVEHGVVLANDAFDAPDLATARSLMASFELVGFDPEAPQWQPSGADSWVHNAQWSDEMASRALPPM